MRISMSYKILTGTIAICLFAVGVLAPMVYLYNKEYTSIIYNTTNSINATLNQEISGHYASFAEDTLKIMAENLSNSASEYIRDREMSESDLVNNEAFRNITVQKFFDTGYSLVVEPSRYYLVTHPLPGFSDKLIQDTPGYNSEMYRPLLKLFDESSRVERITGTYQFISSDGSYKEKLTYLVRIPEKTKDGKTLYIMATVFLDDFYSKSGKVSNRLTHEYINAVVETGTKSGWYNFGITIAVIIIFAISVLVAMIFSKRITKPLSNLSISCKNMSEGDYDKEVTQVAGSDEISDLSKSVENMRQSIKAQSEIIKKQTDVANERAAELEDALAIAKEKTLNLIKEMGNNNKPG